MASIPALGSIPADHFAGGAHVAGQDQPNLAAILNDRDGEILAAQTDIAAMEAGFGSQSIHGPHRMSLVGASAEVHRFVWPGPTVQLTEIHTAISGALTTGDATITASIETITAGAVSGSAAVTDGVVTITQVGSAAGDVDTASPTAANTLVAGNVLAFTVGGTNDAAVFADLTFKVALPA